MRLKTNEKEVAKKIAMELIVNIGCFKGLPRKYKERQKGMGRWLS